MKTSALNKFYTVLMMLVMGLAAMSLTACSDDDDDNGGEDTSALVGTWDVVQDDYYTEDGTLFETEQGNGAYWVFTNNTFTVYEEEDLMNGNTVNYTYSGGKIVIAGVPLYEVNELTSNRLVVRVEIIGGYQITTLRRR